MVLVVLGVIVLAVVVVVRKHKSKEHRIHKEEGMTIGNATYEGGRHNICCVYGVANYDLIIVDGRTIPYSFSGPEVETNQGNYMKMEVTM